MADQKNSFILYADYIHTIRKLPDDKAGILLKTIFSFVNDEIGGNPQIDDPIVDLVFEPIKQQLKRDLKKWEVFRQKQSENGKKGGRPTLNKEIEANPENPSLSDESQKSLNATVTVIGTATGTETKGSTNVELVGTADQYAKIEKNAKSIANFIKAHQPKFIQPYMDLWNLFAKQYGCGQVKSASESRKRKLKVRLSDKKFLFCDILKAATTQTFALESNWFTFDFLIENDNNYHKVLEMKYVQQEKKKEEEGMSQLKYDK